MLSDYLGRKMRFTFAGICLLTLDGSLAITSQEASSQTELSRQRSEASAHHQKGLSLYRAKDPEGAMHELQLSVQIDPSFVEAWNDLGVVQRKEERLSQAVASFEKAVSLSPSYTSAIYNLA